MHGPRTPAILVAMAMAMAPATTSAWTQRAPERIAEFAVGTNVVVDAVRHRAPREGAYQIVRARSSRSGRLLWQRKWRGPGPEWNDYVEQFAFAPTATSLPRGR